ncbi:hypothetical protein FDP41_005689 [Naegleria fowleri]|uniref:Cytochrome P450 n=1 Tax=Naegleria fowleri TaxID=5763 RepID=A0A6A5BK54_NAEFO|nr:uncharacterized protein FDP41_005689 [Naegleria fowleri]KAF0975276.1 hypothetical protein FDP41_005689 [Naegleria fowleri]
MWSLLSIIAYICFLPILCLFLIKFYEGVCVATVRDTKTRKAIRHSLTIWQSLKLLLFNHDQPLPEKLFQIAKTFHFEPFIFYMKGFIPTVVFSDNHAAKTILIEKWKSFEKNTQLLNPMQKSFIGNALVFMNGEEWHANRSVLNPSFQHVEKYWADMCECIVKCVSNIEMYGTQLSYEPQAEKSYKIKIKDMLTRLALDVIGLSALDCEFKYLEPVDMNRVEKYEKVLKAFRYLFKHVNTWERNIGIFGTLYSMLPIEDNAKLAEAMNTLNSFIYSLIEEKREKFIPSSKTDQQLGTSNVAATTTSTTITLTSEEIMGTPHREKSAIETLLLKYYEFERTSSETPSKQQVMNQISFRNLRDDVLLLYIAGHATTAEALSFLLFHLAQYPHVQERLVDELKKSFLGEKFSKNSHLAHESCHVLIRSVDDIHRMNEELSYLDAVVNESLRVVSPLGMLNRLSCENQVVEGLKIPKDYSVSLLIKAIHCNPQIWGEDCEKFDPERWIRMKQQQHVSSHVFSTVKGAGTSPSTSPVNVELPQTSEIFNMGEDIPHLPKSSKEAVTTSVPSQKEDDEKIKMKRESASSEASTSEQLLKTSSPHSMICSFLPFGAGARVCLGQKFSLQEQKLFLIHLLSKYKVSFVSESIMKKKKEVSFEAQASASQSTTPAQPMTKMNLLGTAPIFSLSDDTKLLFTERHIEMPLEYHLYEEDFDKKHITEGMSVGDTGVGLNADEEIPSTSREHHPLDIIHQVDTY